MKKVRYIFELLFIFLIPLLIVYFRIDKQKDYTYDGELLEEEVKTYSYNPITYLSQQETITTYELTHYTTWDFNNYTGDIYLKASDFVNSIFGGGSVLAFNGSEKDAIVVWLVNDLEIRFANDDLGYDEDFTFTIYTFNNEDYYLISVSGFTFDIADSEWEINGGYYLMTSNTETITHYSPIITIKNILSDLILVDSNDMSYSVVFDYTCIWFLMFIIWHLVYLFVDFLLHFWHKRRD